MASGDAQPAGHARAGRGHPVARRGGLRELEVLACSAAVALPISTTAAAKVTSLTSCQTISSPGTYRLDADVSSFGPGLDCFTIFASDFTLFLNGHTITGGGFDTNGIDAFGFRDAIVGPETFSDVDFGIVLAGGNGSVRGVTVTGDDTGIALTSAYNSVQADVITDNNFFAGFGATGNTITGNYVHGNSLDLNDITANCDSNVWRGNDFRTANQSCIH